MDNDILSAVAKADDSFEAAKIAFDKLSDSKWCRDNPKSVLALADYISSNVDVGREMWKFHADFFSVPGVPTTKARDINCCSSCCCCGER